MPISRFPHPLGAGIYRARYAESLQPGVSATGDHDRKIPALPRGGAAVVARLEQWSWVTGQIAVGTDS